MHSEDMDRLLGRALEGGEPASAFKEQVLQASLAAFARSRRRRTCWRVAALSAAAVLIAGVSFLLGRASLARPEPATAAVPTRVAAEGQTVAVPSEVVAWLEAARLFGQLGMDERMGRAIDHAHSLLPYDIATAGDATAPVVAVGGGAVESQTHRLGPGRRADLHESVESVNRIMAQSLGD